MANLKVSHRSATVHDAFVGEGHYPLSLPIGMLEDLQDLCDAGPHFILLRLQTSQWLIKDITETIRLGLIGGGMKPLEALNIVNRNVKSGYLLDYVLLAAAVIRVALHGPEEDPIPEGESLATPEAETQTPNTK